MGEPNNQAQPGPAISTKGAARRRFAARGLGASGVVMTLASQPGMALAACTSASGWMSDGLQGMSNSPLAPPSCAGMTPEFFRTNPAAWPARFPATGSAKFKQVFPTHSKASHGLGNKTLMEVFQLSAPPAPIAASRTQQTSGATPTNSTDQMVMLDVATDLNGVAGHILAAFFNTILVNNYVITEKSLRKMWLEYEQTGGGASGYFKPSGTEQWHGAQIVAYIKTTFGKA